MNKFIKWAIISPVFFIAVSFAVSSPPTKDLIPKQDIMLYVDGDILSIKEPFPPNELCEMVVPKIKDADKPKDLASVNYDWKVYEIKYDKDNKEYRVFKKSYRPLIDNPFGPSILFTSGPNKAKFNIEVVATYVFCTKKDSTVNLSVYTKRLETVLIVVGSNPLPPDNPDNPDVPDVPVFPDGKYKLSKTAYDLGMKYVPADNRSKGGIASANAYKAVSSAIAAGAIKSEVDALKQLKELNQNNLKSAGVSVSSWEPFGVQLQEVLWSLYETRKIGNLEDYRTAFLEISVGLEKIK